MVGINLQYQPFVALNILSQVLFADSGCLLLIALPTAYSGLYRVLCRNVLGQLFIYAYAYIGVCVHINICKYTHIYTCVG